MKGVRIEFNFVPMPREIWTEGIALSLGEFRLLGYLLYYRSRFGHEKLTFTDDELLRGVKDRAGNRLDTGCGLTRNALKAARTALMQKGWIIFEEDLRDKARPKRSYQLNLTDEVPAQQGEPKGQSVTVECQSLTVEGESLTPSLSESDTRSDLRVSRSPTLEGNTSDTCQTLTPEGAEEQNGGEPKDAPLTPEGLVALYNEKTPDECPAVEVLSPARREKARKYLKLYGGQQFWTEVFEQIHHSYFLRGRGAASRDRATPFIADFDWLLQRGADGTENFIKVHDGKYVNRR